MAEINDNGRLYQPHVLLLPYPAQGHLNPMMHLGTAIAELADKHRHQLLVTLATIKPYQEKILRSIKLASSPGSDAQRVSVIGIDDGLPPELPREIWTPEFRDAIHGTILVDSVEAEIQKLEDAGTPVTCIVGDYFLKWVPAVAERAKIPEYVFWPQNAAIFNIYTHAQEIIMSGYNPFDDNVPATAFPRPEMDLVDCVPGVSPMHPADLPFEMVSMKPTLEWLGDLILSRSAGIRRGIPTGVVISALPEIEKEAYNAVMSEYAPKLKIRMAGTLVPLDGRRAQASLWDEQGEECRRWLDVQPAGSVVYVSFGSVTRWTVEDIHEIASGLQASGYRFLWVVRPGSVVRNRLEPPDEEAYNAAFPPAFWEAVRDTGKVVSWTPQAQVLRHVAVGGFLSHCGWNSTLECLAAGKPVLGRPWINDQVTNCRMLCDYWRVGLALPLHCLRRDDVADGIRRLMSDDDIRRRAAKIGDVIKRAAPYADLPLLVEDLVRH